MLHTAQREKKNPVFTISAHRINGNTFQFIFLKHKTNQNQNEGTSSNAYIEMKKNEMGEEDEELQMGLTLQASQWKGT